MRLRRSDASYPLARVGAWAACGLVATLLIAGCGGGVRSDPLAPSRGDGGCSGAGCDREAPAPGDARAAREVAAPDGVAPDGPADLAPVLDLASADLAAVDTAPARGALAGGAPCTGSDQCASGACTDGHCCIQDCTECQACTGAGGTCRATPAGQGDDNPPGACGGNRVCDGRGWCKLRVGEPCGDDDSCVNGYCYENVCCEGPCADFCSTCAAPGSHGRCRPVTSGPAPDTCTGTCNDGFCSGTPAVGLLPTRWSFLTIAVGQTVRKRLSTRASEATPVTVSITGADTSAFSARFSNCLYQRVAPSWTCEIEVSFTPRTAGHKTATLVLAGERGLESRAPLEGTGQ